MTHHFHSQMALLTAICVLGIACSDAPTDSAGELAGPEFAKAGKGGGGKPAGDPPITVAFVDAATHNITSDARGDYVDGVCVDARFNLEDARLSLKGRIKKKDEATCGDPRKILIDFTDRVPGSPPSPAEGSTQLGGFMNVDHVEMVTEADGTVRRKAIFHTPGCGLGLRFNSTQSTAEFTVNDLDVTQNPDGTWTAKTQPFPYDVAVCVPSDHQGLERRYYHMPFSVMISLKPGA